MEAISETDTFLLMLSKLCFLFFLLMCLGTYVMVIGQPLDANHSNKKIINAIKIQIINDANLELYWPLEVMEFNLFNN